MENTHLIFLIHGMGSFSKGWSQGAQQVLQDAYATYRQLKFIPFGLRFEFVEILYDDEFEALRVMWRKMNNALGDALKSVVGEISTTPDALKLVTKLNKAANVTSKDKFLTTHIADALLYFAARQSAAAVRERVREQIFTALQKKVSDGGVLRWSVIAHSLGTAVIHDALHEAYSDKATPMGEKLSGITRVDCLAMISNVSRMLETDIDVYLSRVRPGNPDNPDAAVRRYLNAHNTFDPFTQPKAFKPGANWPSLGVRALGLFEDIETREIESPEKVHDLEHYLRNPRVHAAIFNGLVGQEVLDKDAIDDAHARYVAQTPLGKFGDFVGALKKFQLGEEATWVEIFKKWADFRALVS